MALNESRNGILSKKELRNGMNFLNIQLSSDELDDLFKRIDDNESGGIDYSEFVAASLDRNMLLQQSKIQSCFRLFDRDLSGKIDLKEFKQKFKNGGMTEKEWKEAIHEVDVDGDGEIDLFEF